VRELARGWASDPDTLPWLKDLARSDQDRFVREAAVRELARGRPPTDAAVVDGPRPLRSGWVRAGGGGPGARARLGLRPGTLPWLKDRARSDQDMLVRVAALQEIARGWASDPETLPWLKDLARLRSVQRRAGGGGAGNSRAGGPPSPRSLPWS
jgi:hypothetical protein